MGVPFGEKKKRQEMEAISVDLFSVKTHFRHYNESDATINHLIKLRSHIRPRSHVQIFVLFQELKLSALSEKLEFFYLVTGFKFCFWFQIGIQTCDRGLCQVQRNATPFLLLSL